MRSPADKNNENPEGWRVRRRETGGEVVRHIKMDQAPSGGEKERVIEREEVWKSSHDEMDSTGP